MSPGTRSLSRRARPWRLRPRARGIHRSPGISWVLVATCAATVVLAIAFIMVCVRSMSRDDEAIGPGATAAEAVPTAHQIELPLANFADGQARFFKYATRAGHEIRFFVMKTKDGQIRAAFDACDTCFRQRRGFRQDGDQLVCNHCGRTSVPENIDVVRGTCNPAPLDPIVDGDRVILQAVALEQGRSYF